MAYEIELILTSTNYGLETVDPTSFWVEENVPNGLRLAEITNYDPGVVNFRFRTQAGVLLNNDGRYGLEKDSGTGKWYLIVLDGSKFDYEDLTTHEGIVLEGVNANNIVVDEATVQTYIVDVVNETPANTAPDTIRLDNAVTKSVVENTVVIGVMTATDSDGIKSYAITGGDPDGIFEIVKNTTTNNFELRVKAGKELDYEALGTPKTIALQVTATDNLDATSTAQTITLTVTNVDEAPHTIRLDNAITKTVAENTVVIGVMTATDPEGAAISGYAITGGDPDGIFEIVKNTTTNNFELRVKAGKELDYEALTSKTIALQVTATDNQDATSTAQTITLTVVDANDAPIRVDFGTNQNLQVGVSGENSNVVQATAVDPDAQQGWRDNRYKFANGQLVTDDGLFKIDTVTGQVKLNRAITEADVGDHAFTIIAYDAVTNTLASTGTAHTVSIASATNTAPHTLQLDGLTNLTMNENINYVGTLSAQDDGPVANLSYSFDTTMAGGGNANGIFEIVNGQVRLAANKVLNYEAGATYTIYVKANDGSLTSATQAITITLTDVNDAPTDITFTDSRALQAGVTKANSQVVDAGWTDEDVQPGNRDNLFKFANGTLTSGIFTINATTGVITVNRDLIGTDAGTYDLQVVVYDNGMNTLLRQETYQVQIAPQGAVPPNVAPTGLSLVGGSINEYAAPGAEVGTLSATDANGDALTYTLLDSADGRFAIVGNKLVVGRGVNFEEASTHKVKVQVSDGKGGTAEQVFEVKVTDQWTLDLKGKTKNDKLNGGALDDILNGKKGNDIVKGLAGDDKLYGDVGDDKLYGGLGLDTLWGGKGNDQLRGEDGNDVLYGDEGNDILYGGAGADTFVFTKKANKASNFDQIKDFRSGEDKIFLENKIFKKLGAAGTLEAPAKLDVTMFKAGKAKDKNDFLVYKSGVLYYDANGKAAGGEVEIVKVKGLKATDIFII